MTNDYGTIIFNELGEKKYHLKRIELAKDTRIASDVKHIYIHKKGEFEPTFCFSIDCVSYAWYYTLTRERHKKVVYDSFEIGVTENDSGK